jgi:hypothetical protein
MVRLPHYLTIILAREVTFKMPSTESDPKPESDDGISDNPLKWNCPLGAGDRVGLEFKHG